MKGTNMGKVCMKKRFALYILQYAVKTNCHKEHCTGHQQSVLVLILFYFSVVLTKPQP